MKFKKGAIELDQMGWLILGIVVLVLVIAGIMILRGKGISAIEFIKNIFKFKG